MKSTRLAEFLGLSSFALALMLLISLATYSPADPAPFFKAGASGPARNFIGPAGAFLAELLIPQLFGVAALLLPLVLGVLGWKLFWCRPIEALYTKAAGLALLLASTSAFFSLSFGSVTIEGDVVRAGGATGMILASLLTASFNRTGAYILLATCIFVSVILATQFSFAALLEGVAAFVSARVQAVRTAWAHYRETRRKERMRKEVIKKHTQQREQVDGGGLLRVRRVKTGEPGEEPDDAAGDVAIAAPRPPEETPAPAPKQRPLPFVAATPAESEQQEPAEARPGKSFHNIYSPS